MCTFKSYNLKKKEKRNCTVVPKKLTNLWNTISTSNKCTRINKWKIALPKTSTLHSNSNYMHQVKQSECLTCIPFICSIYAPKLWPVVVSSSALTSKWLGLGRKYVYNYQIILKLARVLNNNPLHWPGIDDQNTACHYEKTSQWNPLDNLLD